MEPVGLGGVEVGVDRDTVGWSWRAKITETDKGFNTGIIIPGIEGHLN